MRLAVDGSALAGNEPVETVEEGESALVVDTYDMTANRMHASGEAALLLGAEVEAALQRLNARACTISPVSLLR